MSVVQAGQTGPVLQLKEPAGQPPWLEFGRLRVGNKKVLPLDVSNDTDDVQVVTLDKLPAIKGFQLLPGPDGTHTHAIPPASSITLQVAWQPREAGPLRDNLTLKWKHHQCFQVVLHGNALGGAQAASRVKLTATEELPFLGGKRKQAIGRGHSFLENSAPNAADAELQGTPSSKTTKSQRLNGSTPPRMDSQSGEESDPHTPRAVKTPRAVRESPYAAAKSPLAPRFMQLSRLGGAGVATALTPRAGNVPIAKVRLSRAGRAVAQRAEASVASRKSFSHFHSVAWMEKQEKACTVWLNSLLQPAADTTFGDNLATKRLAAKLRALLWKLYSEDEGVISVMLRLEKRIDDGFLRLREEESQLGDVKFQENGLEVLGSYHPFWLRLGMEVVVGKPVPLTHHEGGPRGLRRQIAELEGFITEHFLNDAELAYEWAANKAIDGLYIEEYWADLGQMVLKRFLLLALLLDRAVTCMDLPAGVPLLFRKESSIKSSQEALVIFLKDRLFGEGNVVRHLASKGYRVEYEQDPRKEFDFSVSNIAVDLRSGLRICKLVEVLTGVQGLVAATHFPAERRVLQVQNVDSALLTLEDLNVAFNASAEDLVGGVRDKTLGFLWSLIAGLQLPQLLDARTLRSELQRIAVRNAKESSHTALECTSSVTVELQGNLAANELVCLLFKWCGAVCANYCAAVRNFTTSFADGRLLCLMVCFYLPWYIDSRRIYTRTPVASLSSPQQSIEQPSTSGIAYELESEMDSSSLERHRAGVARNFELLGAATDRLGGVPSMLAAEECAGDRGPDEKAVVAYTAFLCARLLEVSREERAAHTMQRAWRLWQATKPGVARAHLHRWIAAAGIIQRTWKARQFCRRLERGPIIRANFLAAVVRVQARWRARPLRTAFLRIRAAAIVLQAVIRGSLGRRRFHDDILAPLILQRCLLAKRELEAERWRSNMHTVVSCLQARRRGLVQRRAFLAQRNASVSIQAAVRGWSARKCYQRARSAATTLQAYWKGCQVRKQLAKEDAAATVIQAIRRGIVQRRWYLQQRQAAVTIQAATRMYFIRIQYLAQRAAAIKLQTAWRALLARRLCERMRAARTIQSVVRGHAVRQEIWRQRVAAILLQAAWRGWRQHRQYCTIQRATISVQACFRCWVAKRKFKQVGHAAVRLQAHTRGWMARRDFARCRAAVIRLQSAWRGALQRRRYAEAREALRREAAATLLQAVWRGRAVRRDVRQCHEAAVVIQAAWRGFCVHRWFLEKVGAAMVLQSHWRGRQARLALKRELSARRIQAVFRGHLQRRTLQHQHRAATTIQAMWRSHQQTALFKEDVRRVILVQSLVRRRQAVNKLQQAKAAATVIQSRVRGFLARRQLCRQAAAATRIQTAWRGARQRKEYSTQRSRVTKLQAMVRGRQQRTQFLQQRSSAIAIQSAWRGFVARRQLVNMTAAATKIQAAWRGAAARLRFRSEVRSVVRLQARTRMVIAQRKFNRLRDAAVVVQSAYRGYTVRRELASEAAAATAIQAHWRGHVQRRSFLQQREAAIKIQAAARMLAARKSYLAMQKAAYTIQVMWRERQMRLLAKANAAATRIQSFWRGRACRQNLAQKHAAATKIQAAWRGMVQQRAFLHARASATKIQALVRMMIAQRQFQSQCNAATYIQTLWRGYRARKFVRETKAATVVQSHFRRWLVQKQVSGWNAAATYIQSYVRMHSDRKRYLAALEFKGAMKEFAKTAREFTQRSAAAIRIQAYVRGFLARSKFRRMQEAHRATLAAEQARRDAAIAVIAPFALMFRDRAAFLRQRQAATIIQRHWRKRLATLTESAVRIQAAERCRQARSSFLAAKKAATVIQARWRGHKTRQEAGQQLAALRRKLQAARAYAQQNPHRILSVRTATALLTLQHAKHLPESLSATKELAAVTAISTACCHIATTAGVSSQLLRMVKACSRSAPHADLLRATLAVLANLASDSKCAMALLETSDCIVVLIGQLQTSRDNEEIFVATTKVLQPLVKDPERSEIVAASSASVKQMQAVAQILTRKLDVERKYLARLEGQKGSDVSAREATRKIVAASRQLQALSGILTAVGASLPSGKEDSPQRGGKADSCVWAPKNTLVRDAFQELSNKPNRNSPPGRKNSPPGRKNSPPGRKNSPQGHRSSPPSYRNSPPNRRSP